MIDETEPEVESDLRRRAAWLLGMLALVAILFVVVMTAVLRSGGSKHNVDNQAPLDNAITAPASTANHSHSSSQSTSSAPTHHSSAPSTPTAQARPTSCPSAQPCAQNGDIGNAIAAINSYRTSHGQKSVPGSVSQAAISCALSNGGDCSGSWAESQVATADGNAAVHKILAFGKLLDSQMKSFDVGWAYDPGGKQYFFAIVRND